MTTSTPTDDLHEAIAAMTAVFVTHPRFGEFSDRTSIELGGRELVYRQCVDLARAYQSWECRQGGRNGLGDDWHEHVENIVEAAINYILDGAPRLYANPDAVLSRALSPPAVPRGPAPRLP